MNVDEKLRQKAQQEVLEVPESFSNRVKETLTQLPPKRTKKSPHFKRSWYGLITAAVVCGIFILPNSSAAMADTMGSLPIVGPLFQVITIRNYQVESGANHVSIENPQISTDTPSTGAQEINQQVSQYIDQMIESYENTATADGYFNLDITWEIVTNTDRWFTLRINSDLILASGNHAEQHYHIDVPSGEQKTLSDLFPEEFDYVTCISNELKEQMKARMEADPREYYWLEDVSQLGTYYFDTIEEEQDFYFDTEGHIVIPFDKYEVGPGATGSPEFTLTNPELYENLLFHP